MSEAKRVIRYWLLVPIYIAIGVALLLWLDWIGAIQSRKKVLTQEEISAQIADKFQYYQDEDQNCFAIYGFGTLQGQAFLVNCPAEEVEED